MRHAPLPRPRTVRRALLAAARGNGAPSEQHTHHRNVQGGARRAAILGAGDGLLTNVSLVLGVAGASTNASPVRLAGVAGLLAGAFSMATGELVSVRAQDELVRHEIESERHEIAHNPSAERSELTTMLRQDGLPEAEADTVAGILSSHDQAALGAHVRLELGVDPSHVSQARQSAFASFVSFGLGAALPLLPWFFTGGERAVLLSILIGAAASIALGAAIGAATGRGALRAAARQIIATAVAAAITFSVGKLIGVSTTG